MSFIPWPNGIQLCFDFTSAGQNWQFCLALRKSSGAPTDADLISATNEAYTKWTTPLKPTLTTGNTLRQIRATDMTVEGGPQYVRSVSEAGTNAGDINALSNAAAVSLRTAKRGRSYRGRIYISGWEAGLLTDQVTFGSGLVTNLSNFVTGLQTALDALGMDLVVPSKQHNNVVTNPAELNEVIAVVIDTKVDSQRRRLSGRGA
jgi:hypothetical protein